MNCSVCSLTPNLCHSTLDPYNSSKLGVPVVFHTESGEEEETREDVMDSFRKRPTKEVKVDQYGIPISDSEDESSEEEEEAQKTSSKYVVHDPVHLSL